MWLRAALTQDIHSKVYSDDNNGTPAARTSAVPVPPPPGGLEVVPVRLAHLQQQRHDDTRVAFADRVLAPEVLHGHVL